MGNVERRFEQELIFNKTSVLNRYIFSENILFFKQSLTIFLRRKGLETNRSTFKMRKWWEKVKFIMSYFKFWALKSK